MSLANPTDPTNGVSPCSGQSAPVQSGLRVRTALRAGEGNPLAGTGDSPQDCLQSLLDTLCMTGAAHTTSDGAGTSA